jgi:predicted nucleic acid-binding protein
VILIDTSAWVEFLRDTGSPICVRVDDLLATDVATCDPIRMEVLAGARDESHLRDLRGLLARATVLSTEPVDYEEAAAIYRGCRRHGKTVHKLIDCLIAAAAIRHGVPVLHSDSDFEVIGRHCTLEIEQR